MVNSSDDGTEDMIHFMLAAAPCDLDYHRKADEGAGSTQNLGVRNALGNIISFTDSDCTYPRGFIVFIALIYIDMVLFILLLVGSIRYGSLVL